MRKSKVAPEPDSTSAAPGGPTCIEDLAAAPYNPRRISPEALGGLTRSIERFGDVSGIVWNARTRRLVSGHQRLRALRERYGDGLRLESSGGSAVLVAPGGERFPVRVVDWDEGTEKAANVAANSSVIAGEFTEELDALLDEIRDFDPELFTDLRMDALLADLEADTGAMDAAPVGSLRERFIVPPFSVLDARQGYWQDRKRAWVARGIASEEGRADDLIWAESSQSPALYGLKNEMRATLGREPAWEDVIAERRRRGMALARQTSVFDPVLCELAYRWFCPPGGRVLDPFAGGSVRGIVAGLLGYEYRGIDLRAEQVAANEAQATALAAEFQRRPSWVVGDSLSAPLGGPCDLLFACPPYADLERYSDDPKDLSTMDWKGFARVHREIILRCAGELRENRFAVWVIANVRDGSGPFRDLVGETVDAFAAAGLGLYNDAVLVTQVHSLAIRASRMFQAGRKLGRTHQNVLVFTKGDWRAAAEACGPAEFGEPDVGEDAEAASSAASEDS